MAPDERTELIEGEIFPMAPIGARHASHTRRLLRLLTDAIGDRAIVDAQNPILLGDDSQPQPDLTVLRSRDDFYADSHPTSQDVLLLIEVCDTSARFDRQTKVPLYARHGIPCVWLVDLNDHVVEVYEHPTEGVYERVHVLRGTAMVENSSLDLRFAAGDLIR